MKKAITLTVLCLFALSVYTQDIVNPQDTIIKTVTTVTQTDPETGITTTTTTETERIAPILKEESESSVIYDGSSYGFIFSWKKKKHLNPHWTGFGMGFMNFDKDIRYGALNVSRSHNFTLNLIDYHKQIGNSNWLFVTGIGTEWSRYHFDENVALTKVDGETFFQPAPNGIDYKSTKLLAYYITFPLLLEYQTHGFFISGGVVGFLKHYSKSQVKYYVDGEKIVTNKGRDLNIRPVDMKLRLQMGVKDISAYAYYSPFSMFDKNKGPDLRTYTIGLMIGL